MAAESYRDSPSAVPTFSGPPDSELIDPNADYSTEFCALTIRPDGCGEAVVLIQPEILKRILSRAQTRDPAVYLWENILRAALIGHVY